MSDSDAPELAATETWTCDRCAVTVKWAVGHKPPALPAHWSDSDGSLYCLGCRRERAAEAGVEGLPEGTTLERRVQLKGRARVEFEVERDPDRGDGEIAKACHSTVAGVKKARERLAAS